MKLSIVIPVYNEERTIQTVLQKVEDAISSLDDYIDDHEIIIIDDGSKDNTVKIIKEKQNETKSIELFIQPENLGKGAAIK